MKNIHETREAWLLALAAELRPLFEDAGLNLSGIRCSCSWPSKTIRKRLGECWHSKASEDGTREIFITPRLDDGLEVAGVLVHELLHAALPDEAGHKGPFKKGMKALGLEGKATATTPGEELTQRLHKLLKIVGRYPHARLNLALANDKKQGTRMLRRTCNGCGCIIRTTQKWIDAYEGASWVCPCGGVFE